MLLSTRVVIAGLTNAFKVVDPENVGIGRGANKGNISRFEWGRQYT